MGTKRPGPEQETVTVSLRLAVELHTRAKVYAARNRTSIQATCVEALEAYLKRKGA